MEGGYLPARKYPFVQRLFALCDISTRFTKGMRANDTQFLLFFLFFLRLSMLLRTVVHVTFFCCPSYNQFDADFSSSMFPKHSKSDIRHGEPLQMSCRNFWETYTLPAPTLCESTTLSRSHVTQVSANGHTRDVLARQSDHLWPVAGHGIVIQTPLLFFFTLH
jgi:hypothetical protein